VSHDVPYKGLLTIAAVLLVLNGDPTSAF
jgi:hypothetical protein